MFAGIPFGSTDGGGYAPTNVITSAVLPGYMGLCFFGQPLWINPGQPVTQGVTISYNCNARIQSRLPFSGTINYSGQARIQRHSVFIVPI